MRVYEYEYIYTVERMVYEYDTGDLSTTSLFVLTFKASLKLKFWQVVVNGTWQG